METSLPKMKCVKRKEKSKKKKNPENKCIVSIKLRPEMDGTIGIVFACKEFELVRLDFECSCGLMPFLFVSITERRAKTHRHTYAELKRNKTKRNENKRIQLH